MRTFIEGEPYPQKKVTGNLKGPEDWTMAIIRQTEGMDRVKDPCKLDVEFILSADRFPSDVPCGTDLDNLLKRLLDALGKTIFRDAKGKDSVVVDLQASKRPATNRERSGAKIRITRTPWP